MPLDAATRSCHRCEPSRSSRCDTGLSPRATRTCSSESRRGTARPAHLRRTAVWSTPPRVLSPRMPSGGSIQNGCTRLGSATRSSVTRTETDRSLSCQCPVGLVVGIDRPAASQRDRDNPGVVGSVPGAQTVDRHGVSRLEGGSPPTTLQQDARRSQFEAPRRDRAAGRGLIHGKHDVRIPPLEADDDAREDNGRLPVKRRGERVVGRHVPCCHNQTGRHGYQPGTSGHDYESVFLGVCRPALWLLHIRVSSIHSRIRRVGNVGKLWRDGAPWGGPTRRLVGA